jgi:hypothetical protein
LSNQKAITEVPFNPIQEAKQELEQLKIETAFSINHATIFARWTIGDIIFRYKKQEKDIKIHAMNIFNLSERNYQRCVQFRKKYDNLDWLEKHHTWQLIINEKLPKHREKKEEPKTSRNDVSEKENYQEKFETTSRENIINKYAKAKEKIENLISEKLDYKKLWEQEKKEHGITKTKLKNALEKINKMKKENDEEIKESAKPYREIYKKYHQKITGIEYEKSIKDKIVAIKFNTSYINFAKGEVNIKYFEEVLKWFLDNRNNPDFHIKNWIKHFSPSLLYSKWVEIDTFIKQGKVKKKWEIDYSEEERPSQEEKEAFLSKLNTGQKNTKKEGFFDE